MRALGGCCMLLGVALVVGGLRSPTAVTITPPVAAVAPTAAPNRGRRAHRCPDRGRRADCWHDRCAHRCATRGTSTAPHSGADCLDLSEDVRFVRQHMR
eukprot:5397718-Prymnesium_polylepis.1